MRHWLGMVLAAGVVVCGAGLCAGQESTGPNITPPTGPTIAPPTPGPSIVPPTPGNAGTDAGTPPGNNNAGTPPGGPIARTPPAGPGATAATQPTAQSVLENLLATSQPAAPRVAPVPPAGATPNAEIQGNAVAPDQPAVVRIPEGGFIWNRVGRLVKDDKTQEWLFIFDADGKNLRDPPMGMVPSRMLMAMQKASQNGTVPTKFRVSGEVTEYEGKNYLYVKDQRIVQDLNQGIGG